MFEKRLRELRKKNGLTMKEFGKKFNLAESTISGYENGNRTPDLSVVEQFADFFEVPVDYLLGRVDYKQPLEKVTYRQNEHQELKGEEEQTIVEQKLKFIRDAYKEMNEEERKDFLRFLDINIEGYQRKLVEERKDRT